MKLNYLLIIILLSVIGVFCRPQIGDKMGDMDRKRNDAIAARKARSTTVRACNGKPCTAAPVSEESVEDEEGKTTVES